MRTNRDGYATRHNQGGLNVLLSPYRVLDLCDERGQLAGQMLAQLGAEVIAIEAPGGSRSRRLAPFAGDQSGHETSLWHRSFNRGKRSVVLDLAASEVDREHFRGLVRGADVVIESGRPGDLAAIGWSYADLSALNPALVMASVTAFGQDGPKALWAATDLTVWASAGPMAITGDADRAPVQVGVPQAFAHGAAELAGAVLIALHERSWSGLGQYIDVSAQQCATAATQSTILSAPNNATQMERMSGGLRLGPMLIRIVWPCQDGYVSVSLLFGSGIGPFTVKFMRWVWEEGFCDEATRDKDWIGYYGLIATGREPISEYERVKEIVGRFCASKTKAELMATAQKRGLLIVGVTMIDDVVHLEHLQARGYWDHIDGVTYPGPFGKCSATPLLRLASAPKLGHDTAAVLAEPPRTRGEPSGAQPAGDGARPALAGLKVLDLMWVMAGPAVSRTLADYGATVVRVESSKHVEVARTLQPFKDDVTGAEQSMLFANLNAGKLGIAVDVRTEEGKAVILDLVRWADVVLESFSPKAMRGFGLGYDVLKAINPKIVMMSSCLFGQTGPLSSFAGFGTMAAAVSGFLGITGWPDRDPCGPYGAYTDYIAPRFALCLLLAAVDHQRRTGEGQYIDFAQAEGALHTLAPAILEYNLNGRVWPRPGNSDRNLHPHGVFRSLGNDRWIAVACENDEQRARLKALVGELDEPSITAWTSRRDPSEATETLQAIGVAAHPVQNSAECAVDPQLAARGHFMTLPNSALGTATIEGPRAHFSRTPAVVTNAGPSLGEHTYQVLTEILGYDADRFAELLVAGALE